MAMRDGDIARLRQAACLMRDRENAALADLKRRVAEIRAAIANLRSGSTGDATIADGFDMSGASEAWRRWQRGRLTGLNAQLAELRIAEEAQKRCAARAIARVQATEKQASQQSPR